MSTQLISIFGLVLMFLIATILPVNMGALGLAMAFLVGGAVVGMSGDDVLAGFPGDLFATLVGITYLFAIARNNGTVDFIVASAVRAVRGNIAAMPWVMFGVTGLLTSIGAVVPASVAIIAPIALRFAGQYGISTFMMGLMVAHGATAGGFSPISIFGSITNGVVVRAGLPADPIALFLASLVLNTGLAVVIFFIFGGRSLIGRRHEGPIAALGADDAGTSAAAAGNGNRQSVTMEGHGTQATANGSEGRADDHDATPLRPTRDQTLTLIGLGVLAVAALGFGLEVGLVAISVAVVLALLSPESQKGAVDKVAWSTVLLICGVVTYVGVMEEGGTIDYAGNAVAGVGAPLLGALLLCYIGGVVSAFASTTGILGAIIPLAVPFLMQGNLGAVGVIAALGCASSVVDVSPFSTTGALLVANASDAEREAYYKKLLTYGALVVLFGPLLCWAVLVWPGWL